MDNDLAGYTVQKPASSGEPKKSGGGIFDRILGGLAHLIPLASIPLRVYVVVLASMYGAWQYGEAKIRYDTEGADQTITAMFNDAVYDDLKYDVIKRADNIYKKLSGSEAVTPPAEDPEVTVVCIIKDPFAFQTYDPALAYNTLIEHYERYTTMVERNFMIPYHPWTIEARHGGFPVIGLSPIPKDKLRIDFEPSAAEQNCPQGWKEFDRFPLPALN